MRPVVCSGQGTAGSNSDRGHSVAGDGNGVSSARMKKRSLRGRTTWLMSVDSVWGGITEPNDKHYKLVTTLFVALCRVAGAAA